MAVLRTKKPVPTDIDTLADYVNRWADLDEYETQGGGDWRTGYRDAICDVMRQIESFNPDWIKNLRKRPPA